MVKTVEKTINPADFRTISAGIEPRTNKVAKKMLISRFQNQIKAGYDASKTTPDNTKLWAQALAGTPGQLMTEGDRRILRNRSRYEVRNNSYARGILDTLANDTIGTGPRLQLLTKDKEFNREVELLFLQWTKDIRFAEKLRVMRISRAESGEVFMVFFNNLQAQNEVTLDVRNIEADFITSPIVDLFALNGFQNVDGVLVDNQGNERAYLVSDEANDLSGINFQSFKTRMLDASQVMHYVKRQRPGQIRGVPEITTSLPLFAQLRRYTLAVLASAETAADFTVLIQSLLPPDGEPLPPPEEFDLIEIEKNTMMTLPEGWTANQLRAEQPTTQYDIFLRALIREIAIPFSMPLNIALGDSSVSNFASGRLDHQGYFKQIKVERSLIENIVLDPPLRQWILEAKQSFPLILSRLGGIKDVPHRWFWDGFEHIDPLKQIKSLLGARDAGFRTDASIIAELEGQDWEETYIQTQEERKLRKELGIPRREFKEEFFQDEEAANNDR